MKMDRGGRRWELGSNEANWLPGQTFPLNRHTQARDSAFWFRGKMVMESWTRQEWGKNRHSSRIIQDITQDYSQRVGNVHQLMEMNRVDPRNGVSLSQER